MTVHPLNGKSFLRVTYPSPEAYYIIPADWKLEDITIKHGELFYKGIITYIDSRDFHSSKHEIEIIAKGHIDYPDCHEFIN